MEPRLREVEFYQTEAGKLPFKEWLDGLKDRRGKARVDARITRLQAGLLGSCKPVGDGVFELKVEFGPGYRIYFVEEERGIVLLLWGGDKGNQQRDIQTAKNYWADYQARERKHNKIMKRKKAAYMDDLRERLKDPAYAAEYLNAVLQDEEDGADAVFLVALRNVAEAFQMSRVAAGAGVNRENLYRMLSGKGNPKLSSLLAVLKALDLHLSVQAND